MEHKSTGEQGRSRVGWEHLEDWVREQVQGFIQGVLEEEVTEFLGRRKSERRGAGNAPRGSRNGHSKARRLTLSCGTISVQRPRVRDSEERFVSQVLPLFARKSKQVAALLPELYLHGLASGDFDLALRGLLGEQAALSAPTIARLKARWQGEYAAWNTRSLATVEAVYLWVDGIYVKAGLEKEKAALLVVLAALRDGRKVVVAVTPGHRESTESWAAVLRDLRARGLQPPRLVIGDGHLGIWGALRTIYPEAGEQQCWNHKALNVLDKVSKTDQPTAKAFVTRMMYAPTRQEAERGQEQFRRWCQPRGYEAAAASVERSWERLVTFYAFPHPHWQHLRTTNPVESPFAAARLRTDAAKRFKRVDNATAVLWKLLMVAESHFRRVKHPELMDAVYRGLEFVDGQRVKTKLAA